MLYSCSLSLVLYIVLLARLAFLTMLMGPNKHFSTFGPNKLLSSDKFKTELHNIIVYFNSSKWNRTG